MVKIQGLQGEQAQIGAPVTLSYTVDELGKVLHQHAPTVWETMRFPSGPCFDETGELPPPITHHGQTKFDFNHKFTHNTWFIFLQTLSVLFRLISSRTNIAVSLYTDTERATLSLACLIQRLVTDSCLYSLEC